MKIFKAIKKGFTLVELVIVIAVIAVLSAVLIPVFGNVVKDSRVSALKASLKTCTSNLIMYSLYNQVDYYTPSVIREFLKSEGIKGLTSDDSEFCEDGYSIWYNQENFNVILVKNEEIVNYVNAGSSTASVRNGNVATMAADIFGNVADGAVTGGVETSGASDKLGLLPRRPEAITPDENLLLIATDEANSYILNGIEEIYRAADLNKNASASDALRQAGLSMNNGNLFDYFGSDWTVQKYQDKFNPQKTAWLNSSGYFYTDSTNIKGEIGHQTIDINNIIVSPDIGLNISEEDKSSYNEAEGVYRISGGIRSFGGDNLAVSLNVLCTIEIASTVNIKLTSDFYNNNFMKTPTILISGNVKLDTAVAGSANAGGTSTVSTVTGGGSNISSVVGAGGGSAVIGGSVRPTTTVTMSSEEFLNWTTSSGVDGSPSVSIIDCKNTTKQNGKTILSTKLSNGQYATKELTDEELKQEFEKIDSSVLYKYNTTSFNVNVNAFLTKVMGNVNFDEKVTSVDIEYNVARGGSIYSTRVFLNYYDENNYIKKVIFNFGVGYISSFDHYYRFANGKSILDPEKDYNDLKEENANAGSIQIRLPDGALNLQSYKNGYTVEVYYDKVTRFFKSEKSEFGEEFKGYVNEKLVSNDGFISKTFTADNVESDFVLDFGSFNRADLINNGETCFINTVKIKRIVIKDQSGNILIAKYPVA